jgi:hypothetical protein
MGGSDERPGLSPLSHHRLLGEVMRDYLDRWRPAGACPRGNPPQVRVYQRIGAPGRPDENVRLEMGRIVQEILSK